MSTWRPITPPPFWKRWLPEFLHGPVRLLFRLGLVALVVGLGIAFFYYLLARRYDLAEVARLPSGPTFFDRNGVEITTPGAAGRQLAPRDEIPDFLVEALRAREDARFFDHGGVDLRGLGRATLRNLRDRNFTQGASTLSMQLARNTFEIRDKSLHRKLLEIALTLRIERRYSKDEILAHYLNRIYFGAGAYGIEQAARTYFGKSTRDLGRGEAALVVGIIRGPHLFSPARNLEKALEQRRQTLDRMIAMGFIDAATRDAVAAEPVVLVDENDSRGALASYALRAVRRELDRVLDDNPDATAGLKVHTTLDVSWQRLLESELHRATEALENGPGWPHPTPDAHEPGSEPAYLQFAAYSTETKTGAVLALVGGRNHGHSGFDRSRSRRDLGPAFEPFVAAAAAERGRLVLPGRPVQTGRQIGPAEVARIAQRCGFSGPFSESEDLFRGAVQASPVELSLGLASLGNAGKRPRPFLISEVRDSGGRLLHQAEPRLTQALTPAAAQDGASVLKPHGPSRRLAAATPPRLDGWILRLGPSGATAIWLGFDKPTPIASETKLEAALDGILHRLDAK